MTSEVAIGVPRLWRREVDQEHLAVL